MGKIDAVLEWAMVNAETDEFRNFISEATNDLAQLRGKVRHLDQEVRDICDGLACIVRQWDKEDPIEGIYDTIRCHAPEDSEAQKQFDAWLEENHPDDGWPG